MASIGYEYEPENEEYIDYEENEENNDDVCFSTKLEELDEFDIINRNSDTINQVVTPDNLYPDPLSDKPLYMKTIPKGGIYGKLPPEPFVNDGIIRESTETPENLTRLKNEENYHKYENSKLKNMSIEQFIKFIANSYLDIINDLLEINSLGDLYEIFTKNDRLISIGVLMLAISIFFIFFQI